MSRWFRFYDGALDDPKVQGLPPHLFKFWVNLLCVASKNNGKLPERDLPFLMRMDQQWITDNLHDLKVCGLLDEVDNGIEPHNWNKRQFKSDDSADRVKRHRNGEKTVTVTADVTPPETETETEQKDIGLTPSTERDEISEAYSLWNQAAQGLSLSKAQLHNATRKKALKQRLAELGGIEGWRAMLEIIGKSPHLLGDNDRGWKITFDWILKPANLTKVMEGNYVRAKTSRPNSIAARFDAIRASIAGGSEQSDPPSPEDSVGLPGLRQGTGRIPSVGH